MPIRPYRPNDFPFVARCCLDYARESGRRDPNLRRHPPAAFGAAYARSLLRQVRNRRGLFLLAEVGRGRRAGFVVGLPAPISPAERLVVVREVRPCIVYELYVVPAFRRRGVGRRLLQAVERQFGRRGYDWIRLEVQPRNRPAVRLYRSMGYKDRARVLGRPIRSRSTERA